MYSKDVQHEEPFRIRVHGKLYDLRIKSIKIAYSYDQIPKAILDCYMLEVKELTDEEKIKAKIERIESIQNQKKIGEGFKEISGFRPSQIENKDEYEVSSLIVPK